jgi:beta-glucosidase
MAQARGAMKYSERVESLVTELTLEEKITLLAAKNIWETPEIDRLGIPSLKVSVTSSFSSRA